MFEVHSPVTSRTFSVKYQVFDGQSVPAVGIGPGDRGGPVGQGGTSPPLKTVRGWPKSFFTGRRGGV